MAFVFLFLHTLGLEKSLISPIKNLRYLAAVDFDSFVTGLKLAHFNIVLYFSGVLTISTTSPCVVVFFCRFAFSSTDFRR